MSGREEEILPLSVLFYKRWFPVLVQCLLLVVLALLTAGGLTADTADMSFARILRNTNLANLLVEAMVEC